MRIGIDARFYSLAGPGRYVKNLIKTLEKIDKKNEYCIFLSKQNFHKYSPQSKKYYKVLADYPWYSFKEQLLMPLAVAKAKVNFMHFPHFNIPLLYFGPYVLTIHDLIMHFYSTQRATTRNLLYYKFKRTVYKFVVWWAVRRARYIFVPSNATKWDLIKTFPFSKEKIIVTYEGAEKKFKVQSSKFKDDNNILKKYSIRRPYLFYLGSMYPHKNVRRLIAAFTILKEKYRFKGQLVLVGKKDYFSRSIKKETERLKCANDLVFPALLHPTGYVSDSEVIELFTQASLFVFPSLKEGFGLPLIEAMSLGVPVAASDIDVVREISGDAVLYFDPYKREDIAGKIWQLLTDSTLRGDLKVKGKEKIRTFSWEKMAQQTLEVYNRI